MNRSASQVEAFLANTSPIAEARAISSSKTFEVETCKSCRSDITPFHSWFSYVLSASSSIRVNNSFWMRV
jgi:hypothetical protein